MTSRAGASALATTAVLMSAFSATSLAAQTRLERGIELYWSGRYRDSVEALSSLCASDGRDDERVECLKYLAFSHVALGDGEGANGAFGELLAVDPGYALDTSEASPKIQRQFEASRREFVEKLFQRGKELYYRDRFAEAKALMVRVLGVAPEHPLAREYEQLAAERAELTEELLKAEMKAPEPPEPEPEPAVAQVDEERVYHLTSRMTPPSLLVRVDPEYPASARRASREGTVVLTIVVGRDGSVRDPKIIRSLGPDVDEAALDAVLRWRYRPARLEGQPIAAYSVIRLTFQLE